MDKNTNIEKLIRKAFYELSSPSAYAGADKVYGQVKKINKAIKYDDVKKYLEGEPTYTLHKPRRVVYPRLKTIPTGLNSHWQCDLAIFDKIADKNNGYKYLLVCIDVLSRKIHVSPAKSKSSGDMKNAFDAMWKKAEVYPNKLYSDQGLEFQAKQMIEYFQSKYIQKHVIYSPDIHAGVVERAIRTIKGRLYKYFAQQNTNKWVDVIDKIVEGINNSINRTIGVTPNSVNYENSQELLEKVYKVKESQQKSKFNIGDLVRIDKEKGKFPKSYLPNFTEEIFRIDKVKTTVPIHYRIVDLQGEEISGVFYDQNLSKTKIDSNSRISEILKERTNRRGEKEYFVHWIGEPNSNNQWIKESSKHKIV